MPPVSVRCLKTMEESLVYIRCIPDVIIYRAGWNTAINAGRIAVPNIPVKILYWLACSAIKKLAVYNKRNASLSFAEIATDMLS